MIRDMYVNNLHMKVFFDYCPSSLPGARDGGRQLEPDETGRFILTAIYLTKNINLYDLYAVFPHQEALEQAVEEALCRLLTAEDDDV